MELEEQISIEGPVLKDEDDFDASYTVPVEDIVEMSKNYKELY